MANLLSKTEVLQVIQDAKKKSFAYITVSLIIIIILIIGAVQPTLSSINKVLNEISIKKNLISVADEKINSLTTLKREYEESISGDIKDISLIFPARGDLSFFLVNIDELSRNNGFEVENIAFDFIDNDYLTPEVQSLQVLEPYNVTLQITGDPNNFISLLNQIEDMPSKSVIQKVTIGKENEYGLKNYTVDIRIFRVKEANFYSL